MSIYKPSLLDKFKDFVNGLRSNWDEYEDHVADFEAHLAESVSQAGGAHGLVMERGTFTPAFGSTDNNGTVTHGKIFAEYVRLGDLVHITIRMDNVSYSGGSGCFRISGLPFAGRADRDKYNFVLAPNNIDKNNIGKVASVVSNILVMRPDSGFSQIPVADFTGKYINVSGVYQIAN